MSGQSGLVFQVRCTGYLERAPRVSKDVVAAAFILHEEIGVEREPDLEPRLINPVAMTYRVYSSELSDEHVDTLKAHAESGEPIKFKGQPHLVKAVVGNWNILFNRPDINYDLIKVRK